MEDILTDFREFYGVTGRGAYLMNAAIGGIHRETLEEIQMWSEMAYQNGAINDQRFFHLLEEARLVAGDFLGLPKEDVAFSGSTSLNMNFLAMMMKDLGVKKVITPEVEFPSSTVPWFHHGFDVCLIKEREGKVWEEDLISEARGEDSVVVCSGVQFLTGQRMDLHKISKAKGTNNFKFVINGTQHIGQFNLNLSELNYTAFTASLHKWLGADLGVSLLTMPSNQRNFSMPIAGWAGVEEPWRLANEMPNILSDMGAFQIGTVPFNMIAGAKRAMEVQNKIGRNFIEKSVLDLSSKLRGVIESKGFKMLSPKENPSGINTFSYDSDLEKALHKLEENDVFVNGRRGSIRASIHFYNNEQDIEMFEQAIDLI